MGTFFRIKEQKTKIIVVLFSILMLFYFFTAIAIWFITKIFLYWWKVIPQFEFTLQDIFIAVVVSIVASITHFYFSTRDATNKILSILSAQKLDLRDTYHLRLKNIVEETQIAAGIYNIEVHTIPTIAMNAFALEDFGRRKVVGVTEGAISRLKKEELRAVVAHEISHLILGDCLSTTISCTISNLYSAILEKVSEGIKATRRFSVRWLPYLITIYVVLSIFRAMSFLLKMAISRQREYRADATAVQLTRDPLSLASALYKISRKWRGVGNLFTELSPIFIMNPMSAPLDEGESSISVLFSTHPPIKKRVKILLDIARSNLKLLEDKIKSEEATAIRQEKPSIIFSPSSLNIRWFAVDDIGKWNGPFTFEELTQKPWFHLHTWVKREGEDKLKFALDEEIFNKLFQDKIKGAPTILGCPSCKVSLCEISYEGIQVYGCEYCKGVLVEETKILKIILRRDIGFNDEVIRLAEIMNKDKIRKDVLIKPKFQLTCPSCKIKMIKKFYSAAYLVEVDYCNGCKIFWFEENELELLQYLIEKSSR